MSVSVSVPWGSSFMPVWFFPVVYPILFLADIYGLWLYAAARIGNL